MPETRVSLSLLQPPNLYCRGLRVRLTCDKLADFKQGILQLHFQYKKVSVVDIPASLFVVVRLLIMCRFTTASNQTTQDQVLRGLSQTARSKGSNRNKIIEVCLLIRNIQRPCISRLYDKIAWSTS